MIQEKLIKFATRIPVFMYLTEFREFSLKDVITKLEPGLFKKVTGLQVSDFDLLVSLGLFNEPLMNDAVYKFKRYEDASYEYAGVRKRPDNEDVGLFSTVISHNDYNSLISQQTKSMIPNERSKSNAGLKTKKETQKKDSFDSKVSSVDVVKVSKKSVVQNTANSKEKNIVKVGDQVIHNKFGIGRITELPADDIIKINLTKSGKSHYQRQLHFPRVF